MSEPWMIAIFTAIIGFLTLIIIRTWNRKTKSDNEHEKKHIDLEKRINGCNNKTLLDKLDIASEIHENELTKLVSLNLANINTKVIQMDVLVSKHEKDIYGLHEKIDTKFDKLDNKIDVLSEKFTQIYNHVNHNTNSVNDLIQTLKDMNKK
jgi:hypothetical protein